MKDMMRDASYAEYKRFCEVNGLKFVPYEEYGFAFWVAFCKQHAIENAVATDEMREESERKKREVWSKPWLPAGAKRKQ